MLLIVTMAKEIKCGFWERRPKLCRTLQKPKGAPLGKSGACVELARGKACRPRT